MAVRVSLIVLCLLVYFYSGSAETELVDVVYQTYVSLALFLLFFWVSPAFWAQSIAIIEMTLVLVGSSVVYNWEGQITPIDIYYTTLHDAAIVAEMIIMGLSLIGALRVTNSCGNSSHSSNIYRDFRNQRGGNL